MIVLCSQTSRAGQRSVSSLAVGSHLLNQFASLVSGKYTDMSHFVFAGNSSFYIMLFHIIHV